VVGMRAIEAVVAVAVAVLAVCATK
jgi:hypothetical protein